MSFCRSARLFFLVALSCFWTFLSVGSAGAMCSSFGVLKWTDFGTLGERPALRVGVISTMGLSVLITSKSSGSIKLLFFRIPCVEKASGLGKYFFRGGRLGGRVDVL